MPALLLILSLLCLLPLLQPLPTGSLPPEEQIHHVTFLQDKLFYTTKSGQHFGFIAASNG